jgi:hypothetical protein
MDESKKLLWAILGLPLIAILVMTGLGPQTDRASYEALQIGMSKEQVQAILEPPSHGRYARHFKRRPYGDDDTITLNERMIVVLRDGKLVHKQWIGKSDE